jgi:ATP-dependent RNA helicase DHX29
MAGKKKTKKPAANPARGFATTSVASSKPRADVPEIADETLPGTVKNENAPQSRDAPPSVSTTTTAGQVAQTKTLSPEEFERQLEESELQLLVEKYAQKVRRDAQRQKTRLETDRRLLRGQAESLNAKKWLPQELMDHVLDLIQAEGRFAASSVSSDGGNSRLPAEEDLTIKLWTLQQTLAGSDCPQERIQPALQYVLDIAPNISVNAKSESIWGLEEVMDWLARECARDELPDYTGRIKTVKSQTGKCGLKPWSMTCHTDCS